MKTKKPKRKSHFTHEPTKVEIRKACEEIRGRWSPREKESRPVTRPIPWLVPEFILPQETTPDLKDVN